MYKFENNTQTQLFVDAILDMDVQASEEISETELRKIIEHPNQFQDGIDSRIIKLGYDGAKDDVKAKVQFITEQFKKHGIDPVSPATLKNWYNKAAPRDDNQSRQNVYKLCFALEMNAIETAEFFFKSYLTRPFNYKDTAEAAYYWCLLNEKSYADAEKLIDEIKNAKTETRDDRDIETESLGNEISYIKGEAELVSYLAEHKYDKSEQHITVTKKISELIENCKKAANDELKCRYDLKDSELANVVGAGTLLDVIYGYKDSEMKETIAKSSTFPNALKANWPNRQTFENIEKHKISTEDAYRKTLILLIFYDFYANAYVVQYRKNGEGDIDLTSLSNEFESELDGTLAECGYVQMYYRNPFDGIIYVCEGYKNPLDKFRNIIDEFYLENTGSPEK